MNSSHVTGILLHYPNLGKFHILQQEFSKAKYGALSPSHGTQFQSLFLQLAFECLQTISSTTLILSNLGSLQFCYQSYHVKIRWKKKKQYCNYRTLPTAGTQSSLGLQKEWIQCNAANTEPGIQSSLCLDTSSQVQAAWLYLASSAGWFSWKQFPSWFHVENLGVRLVANAKESNCREFSLLWLPRLSTLSV